MAEPKEHVFYQAEWNGFFGESRAHPKMPEHWSMQGVRS